MRRITYPFLHIFLSIPQKSFLKDLFKKIIHTLEISDCPEFTKTKRQQIFFPKQFISNKIYVEDLSGLVRLLTTTDTIAPNDKDILIELCLKYSATFKSINTSHRVKKLALRLII